VSLVGEHFEPFAQVSEPGPRDAYAPTPMPQPHRDERSFETGRNVYPTFARRVADLCDALNALALPDPHGRESAFYAHPEGGVLGLYNEEGEDTTDPHAGLEGWLVPDGDLGWTLIPRKARWADSTPSDAETPSQSGDSSVRFVDDEGYWLAEDPSRPGCHHIGPSREAALAGLADAREHYDAVRASAEGGEPNG
jgi:hypothetical protein